MNKHALYRFIAPFRSRLQRRLREERLDIDVGTFKRSLETDGRSTEMAELLWQTLRAEAFVPDFRPEPDDSLSKVYGMGPEEVRDDLLEPLMARLELNVDRIDFRDFDFASIQSPRDAVKFMMRVADTQGEATPVRFGE